MSKEQKTITIDTSELVERQQNSAKSANELPETIKIDSEEIARRYEEARRESMAQPADEPSVEIGRPWYWIALIIAAVVVVIAYFVVG